MSQCKCECVANFGKADEMDVENTESAVGKIEGL